MALVLVEQLEVGKTDPNPRTNPSVMILMLEVTAAFFGEAE